MLDSSTKPPENRLHLYDPVSLIDDTYNSYRPSNYTVRPIRHNVSYNNFVDTTNNNISLRLKSSNTINDTHNTEPLKSYDTFELDSFTLKSYTQNISSETTNGPKVTSRDDSSATIVDDRNDGGLRFVIGESVTEDDQSDVSTPRLWRPSSPLNHNTSPKNPTNPKFYPSNNNNQKSVDFSTLQTASPKSVNADNSPTNPLNSNNHNYQSMSANSRTQAIARGRRELMDMVRDLPETFYELSLKDIVELKGVEMEVKKEIDIPENKKKIINKNQEKKKQKKSSKKVKKSESKKKMVRSKSVNTRKFHLKTSVFSIWGSRKSKKSFSSASSFKVAPMAKEKQTSKVRNKEWWRRKSCISSESDLSTGFSSRSSSSSSSSSSNGRRSNRFLPNCCVFKGRRIGGKK